MMREFIMRKPCVILATLFCNNVNAEWGQEWGSMVWGQSSANAPMMGGFGQLIFFGLLLVIGVFVTKRWGLIKTLPAIAVLSLMPLMVDADEIQLNTFQNGQVADADDVNENFNNLKTAIENNSSFTIVSRTSEMSYSEAPFVPNESNKIYEISVFCENGETAISGSCTFKSTVQYTGQIGAGPADALIFRNQIENNGQFCTGMGQAQGEGEVVLIAQVNCLP